jgi:hypothetical protein
MSLRSRIRSLEAKARQNGPRGISSQPAREFEADCICFPTGLPMFDDDAEADAAFTVKCPLHGDRFQREWALIYPVWEPNWIRKQGREALFAAGDQFAKALKTSNLEDIWAAKTEIEQPGNRIVLVLKDGRRLPAYRE